MRHAHCHVVVPDSCRMTSPGDVTTSHGQLASDLHLLRVVEPPGFFEAAPAAQQEGTQEKGHLHAVIGGQRSFRLQT